MRERDENGRFIKGKSGNPSGRPPKEREERYREILVSTCTFAAWERIVKKAVEQAERGNKDARKWLADYLVGTPVKQVDIKSGGETIKTNTIIVREIVSDDPD